jgi:two-component system, NarL family, nitrate/nitrite response regulator NarL
MPIKVVLVDDHPLVLGGLEQLLSSGTEFKVVAACDSVEAGYEAVMEHQPDVLVLDLMLPGEGGLALLGKLEPNKPPAVIVLTAVQDEDLLLDAARLGARGIVLKAMAPRILEESIRAVYNGERRLTVEGVDLSQRLLDRQRVERELGEQLTPRELEILRLVALKLENQEIANRLNITVGTVKIHLHHVFDKLHVNGRHELLQRLRDRRYWGEEVKR